MLCPVCGDQQSDVSDRGCDGLLPARDHHVLPLRQVRNPKSDQISFTSILDVRVWWETVKRQRDLVHLQAGKKMSKRSTSRLVVSEVASVSCHITPDLLDSH